MFILHKMLNNLRDLDFVNYLLASNVLKCLLNKSNKNIS